MNTSKYYWLNQEARTFLSRGYLNEEPEVRIRNIAEKAEEYLGIEGFADKFEDYMSRGFYSLSTPVWINFGKDKGLPISCYNSHVDDSMDSILDTAKEIGMMSKYGGGTSVYLGDIRPRGTEISTGGKADGPVHYAKLYDTTIDVSKQSEARRGACAVYLPIEHDDILEFLDIATEGNPIQNLQTGVSIGDHWLKEMKAGDASKRKVWAKIIQTRSEIGYPYLFFRDNANRNTPYFDLGYDINASNLCVSGDTIISVEINGKYLDTDISTFNAIYHCIEDKNLVKVKSYNLESQKDEYQTVLASAMTSPKAKIMKITDQATGKSIKCTPEHQVYTKNRGYVMAKDLKEDDELIIL